MSKTYQLKMTAPKAEAKTLDATPASGKAPITLQAQAGARYQLNDVKTGFAPDNIRVARSGKHLKIFVDGVSEPAFVIENFYDHPIEDRLVLSGKAEDGSAYAYTPENASSAATVAQLKDDGLLAGMALGGEGMAAGAAVGLLAPVAAFNPLLLAAGALGAAAAAGGGGGDGGTTAPTNNTAAKVSIAAITEDTGSSNQDFYTSDNTLTYTGKIAGYVNNGDVLKLELKNSKGDVIATETVTPQSDGTWSWTALDSQNPRVLDDGNYTLIATLVDKTGNRVNICAEGTDSQILTIDASGDSNTDPSDANNTPKPDDNRLASVEISAVTEDTGVSTSDFYTADNSLIYTGKIAGYKANGDQVKLELRNSKNELVASGYADPQSDGQWSWQHLDAAGKALVREDGNYTLVATLVDKAGNRVNTGNGGLDSQIVTIDTSTVQNTDQGNSANAPANDANRLATIDIKTITDDTGLYPNDFYTADNTLSYSGTLEGFTLNGDAVCLTLKDSGGTLLSKQYVTPSDAKHWTWSDVERKDGVYVLEASIVDKAGNALTTPVSKTIHVDTSNSINTSGEDPNAKLGLNITSLIRSDTISRTGLADFYNNAPSQSLFTGSFTGGNWSTSEDKLRLEIFETDGTQKISEVIEVSGNTWKSSMNMLKDFSNGTYVLRATVEDLAGNAVLIDTQSFVIDDGTTTEPLVKFFPLDGVISCRPLKGGELTLNGVTYTYSGKEIISTQDLNAALINYTFKDYAGNVLPGDSGTTTWSGKIQLAASTTVFPAQSITDLTGEIGTYKLNTAAAELDLSKVLVDKGTSVFNAIDLTGLGDNKLTITVKDLLDIGLTDGFVSGSNTFSKDKSYSSDIQFKIKGDINDTVTLKSLTNTTTSVTLGGEKFNVYHAAVGNMDLDVFVLEGMKVSLI